MQNYRIVLAYDGTDFKGWQRQPAERTVQGTLEAAVFKITRKKTPVHGAGRTDAGVHAMAQVAGFRVATRLAEADLQRALNAVLPWDVRVLELAKAPATFHPRRSARSKVYRYRIVLAPRITPFDFRYALHWPYPLDLRAMRRAAALFVRRADFTAFSSNRERNPVRTVRRSDVRKRGGELVFTIEAEGFLRYMVRTIVGTLLEVGRGRIAPEDIEAIFRRKERLLAGATAPAKGLCLVRVDY
ncbi:MAG TPA: tRNA pseudouridine(38-40) synthase TruA [Terriglobales bacterium]|nr:tRNA pseudouridine(38-40) synthase TruA [Terriglobales bacterium]